MAYAAITDTLKAEVSNKISNMKLAEVNTMVDSDNLLKSITENTELREHAVNLLWKNTEPDLRDRLSKYNKEANIKFKFFVPAEYRSNGETLEVTANFVSAKVVPCMIDSVTGYGARTTEAVILDFATHPLLAEFAEAHKNRLECSKRWDAVNAQVGNFLNSCKSANEAVKLWPDVARYLSKKTLDKVNEKSAKQVKDASSALAALQAIDIDQANTSAVLARMAGATF